MRQHLLASFDSFWIDVLNGSSRETGKRTPDGEADPSVFSTPFNREGIKVGTAIGLMVRGTDADKKTVAVICGARPSVKIYSTVSMPLTSMLSTKKRILRLRTSSPCAAPS
jgi:hypothetical protein